MTTRIEVYADATCPFTHLGLKKVLGQLEDLDRDVEVVVRAWPLEWVNGEPLQGAAVAGKAKVLTDEFGEGHFDGFDEDAWPLTTLPSLSLAAAAYEVDNATGLAVSLAIRAAVFEQGLDISDPTVLDEIADAHGVPRRDHSELHPQVTADYDTGKERGVRGSPDFWVGTDGFFCPALSLSHDAEGSLLAELDEEGLANFVDQATR